MGGFIASIVMGVVGMFIRNAQKKADMEKAINDFFGVVATEGGKLADQRTELERQREELKNPPPPPKPEDATDGSDVPQKKK